MKGLWSLLVWGAAVYLCLAVVLFFLQRRMLYFPDQTVPVASDYGLPGVEAVELRTADGLRLHAWWRPPRTPEQFVLAYFHGNAGHIGYRADKIRPFIDAGYGVLLVSYRYNAGAGGSPSEPGLYEDGRAAFRFLQSRGIGADRVVTYGESLGSAVAVTLAVEHRVAGVALEAPYTSIAEVAQSHYWYFPAKWMLWDKFDIREKIARIDAPLLIVHGERDRIIPAQFGHALFARAVEPKTAQFLPRAGHNDLYEYGAAERVLAFIGRLSAPPRR